MRILLIEDDHLLANTMLGMLRDEQNTVDWLDDGQQALNALLNDNFDLAILDLTLPRVDGLDIVKKVRSQGIETPVIILTARGDLDEQLQGLNAGADDYLVKPFDLSELSARIGSVARRYSGNPNPILTHGPLDIDLAARSVHRDGRHVPLTAREWALFEAFLARPGQLLSKAQLEEKLYAFDAEVESNTIEVHVSRLRKKLGSAIIETERGMGYRLGKP